MMYLQHADLLSIVFQLLQALLDGVDVAVPQIQVLKVSAPGCRGRSGVFRSRVD